MLTCTECKSRGRLQLEGTGENEYGKLTDYLCEDCGALIRIFDEKKNKAQRVESLIQYINRKLNLVEGNGTYDIPFLEEVFQEALRELKRIKTE